MLPFFLIALATASPGESPIPAPTPSVQAVDDFGVVVTGLRPGPRGVTLTSVISNRVAATHLFVHLEPNETDAKDMLFVPSEPLMRAKKKDAKTFYLKTDGSPVYQVTLFFPIDRVASSGVLVVGESDPPYRQVAIALDPKRFLKPDEPVALEPLRPPRPSERVIARFQPALATLGAAIVLPEGHSGPDGEGWVRIYTEVPDVTLDQLQRAIEHPQQVWSGLGGQLFIVKVSATRAIAVEVKDQAIHSARMVTKETFLKLVGPGTAYPSRIVPTR